VVSSTPRPHFTLRKDPVPVVQEVGWAPGPVWIGGKSRPHRNSIPDRPARSQSLYRLSYRGHIFPIYIIKINIVICVRRCPFLFILIYCLFYHHKLCILLTRCVCGFDVLLRKKEAITSLNRLVSVSGMVRLL